MNSRNVNRVTSQGFGYAFSVVALYTLKTTTGVQLPDEVVLALGTMVTFGTQIGFSMTDKLQNIGGKGK